MKPETLLRINPDALAEQLPKPFVDKLRWQARVSIIYVCTGNYNRSPALQLLTREGLKAHPIIKARVTSKGIKRWRETGMGVSPFLVDASESPTEASGMISTVIQSHDVNPADAVLTVSEKHRRELVENHLISKENCVALPSALFGSDKEFFDPQKIVDLALKTQDPSHLAAARLATRKMMAELEWVVNKGIIPALLKVAR